MGLIFVKTQDGKRKPSLFVFVFFLTLLIGLSSLFFFGDHKSGLESMSETQKTATGEEPSPIDDNQFNLTKSSETDSTTENAITTQIEFEKEQGGGYLPEERIKEIRDFHEKKFQENSNSVFRTQQKSRLEILKETISGTKPTTNPEASTAEPKTKNYQTFSERMGNKEVAKGTGGITFESPKPNSDANARAAEKNNSANNSTQISTGKSFNPSKNFQNMLPLGTFIPCILEGDVITTDLSSHVWATVALDVTFRRQLQLPKGLVRARGNTATEPVHDMVDIHFDTLVFSDGTELPISGYAYAALDPRYPNRYKIRGIPGELIKPPLYLKLQALLYSAAIGASEAYVQNFINENTETNSSFTTVPVINPSTGQVTEQIQQNQRPPVNQNIGATIGLSAAQSSVAELLEMAKKDLEKFRPYAMVEKGTPIYIQLDNTIDLSKRAINGVAIAAAEAEAQNKKVPIQTVYAPGDARAKYNTPVSPNGLAAPSIAAQTDEFLKQLNTASGMSPNSKATPTNYTGAQPKPSVRNSENFQTLNTLLQSLQTK